MFFKPQAHTQHTFQDGKMGEESWCFSWQLKSKSAVGLTHSPLSLFLSLLLALNLSHLFCRPQLIHIVTPFNRGQAVKDPITEVKHTFHIFSADLRVWTTNFMWKCIEIGGEFMRGVEWSGGEEGKGGEVGEGRLCQNGRARVGESASASSVNVIARMWKMRRQGSRAERKVRACLTQNNWLEDGLIRPLNQLPSLFLSPFSRSAYSFTFSTLEHLFFSSSSFLISDSIPCMLTFPVLQAAAGSSI